MARVANVSVISQRPAKPEDQEFLFELYCSTRREEVAAWGWDTSQQDAFLRMQFRAQQVSYRATMPRAVDRIVLVDGNPAGRILVDTRELEIVLADIALLLKYRGRGIGTRLIDELLRAGIRANRPVTLSVSRANLAAIRLYERLGFLAVDESELYLQMEIRPVPLPADS
jgi:ribosomal protein S18 acetylase RimI-like enzyme